MRYECPRCHGKLLGLSPFEGLLEDGMGAAVWVASAAGEPGDACPFCSRPMHRPGGDAGPKGLAVCRTCLEVWIPASASAWMSEHAARRSDGSEPSWSESARPSECPTCGAPLQPDELGRCRYCHAQVSAPAPVIMAAPAEDPGSGHDLLEILTGLFTRPL